MIANVVRRVRGTRAGLSVMETLVAVALIAVAFAPLYQLQRTLADAAIALEETARRLEAEASALDFIAAINPMERPSGELDLGAWTLRWDSRVLDSQAPAQGYVGGFSFDVALYEVTATLDDGERARDYIVRKTGWRRRATSLDAL